MKICIKHREGSPKSRPVRCFTLSGILTWKPQYCSYFTMRLSNSSRGAELQSRPLPPVRLPSARLRQLGPLTAVGASWNRIPRKSQAGPLRPIKLPKPPSSCRSKCQSRMAAAGQAVKSRISAAAQAARGCRYGSTRNPSGPQPRPLAACRRSATAASDSSLQAAPIRVTPNGSTVRTLPVSRKCATRRATSPVSIDFMCIRLEVLHT